jgi:hypothetical protein
VIGDRFPLVSGTQAGYQKIIHSRSLFMLAIAILASFLVFMSLMNIIDFGRID